MLPAPNPRFPTALVARRDLELLQLALRAHLHQPAIALWRATEFVMLRDVAFGMPVLDLGCGTGEVARVVLGSHTPVDGLEYLAREAGVALASGVYRSVVRADATRAPLRAGAYATVYSQSVLEHIPDDLGAIREAARTLAPGGRLVFTVPAPAFAARVRAGPGGQAALDALNARLGHHHYRSLDEWCSVLGGVGLRVIASDGHLPAATQRAWQRLDALLVRRAGGRRVLDWFRAAQRRKLIPKNVWVALWTALLWRPFHRAVDDPGGYLIVAQKRA
ncbi:MAG: class I SAM-dependent methyltransferase [Actinobacteria bacterium]|nr:class I SAM-dependent methyltransferase [Actinomycetota bacterium]